MLKEPTVNGDFDLFAELPAEPVVPSFENSVEKLVARLPEKQPDVDIREVLVEYTRGLTAAYLAALKEQDAKTDTLKQAIYNLRKLFEYDSSILVDEEPLEPELAEYASKCTKCGGSGFLASEGRYCECRIAWKNAHDNWRGKHEKWKNDKAIAARRQLRNERDIAASQGKTLPKARKKSRHRPIYGSD